MKIDLQSGPEATVNETFTLKCHGCDRYLMRRVMVEKTPPTESERRTGILGWEKVLYFFRPWVATLLSRTRRTEFQTPAGPIPAIDCAQVCSRACIDKIRADASWLFDPSRIEMRGIGRKIHWDGDDWIADTFTRGAPPPAKPSDEWVEIGQKGRFERST